MKTKTYLRIANVVQAVHDVLSCDGVVICDTGRTCKPDALVFPSLKCLICETTEALYPKRRKLPNQVIKVLSKYMADTFDLDQFKTDPEDPLGKKIPLDPIKWLQESCILEDELVNFIIYCEDELAGVHADEGDL